MQNVFFTSDIHFFHKNIFKHCPDRINICGAKDENDIETWDKWIIEKWNSTIGKKDIVYILGDFAFGSSESVKKLLGKLNGKKFLILGNHDKSSEKLENYFVQITQQKLVTFKKANYDFLEEDFMVFMCHYAMITWPSKHYGVVQCMGHSHGRLDDYNEASTDLRVDVGIDGNLAKFDFITLEQLYGYFKKKTDGQKFLHYATEKKNENCMLI